MTANELRPLVQGLTFTEAPRWHQGRLWFSDFYSHRVLAVDPAGKVESIVTVPAQPSGLGWRPDGTMLIVSMLDRKLMRLEGGLLVGGLLLGSGVQRARHAAGRAQILAAAMPAPIPRLAPVTSARRPSNRRARPALTGPRPRGS